MEKKFIFSEWSFFIFTFAFSWSFWLIAILLKKEFLQFPTIIFYILGGLGPLAVSLILLYTNKNSDKKEFWKRVYSFKRVGIKWFSVIFIVAIAATLLAILLAVIIGDKSRHFDNFVNFFTDPVLILSTLGLNILAVIFEELGWRGYALPRLQERFSALVSSLILGGIWALWHLPLFFITGTYQQGLELNSMQFWIFTTGFFAQSILITWIFNNTERSILAALLFHLFVNLFGEIFDLNDQTELIRFIIFNVFALLVIVLWSPKNFTESLFSKLKKEEPSEPEVR